MQWSRITLENDIFSIHIHSVMKSCGDKMTVKVWEATFYLFINNKQHFRHFVTTSKIKSNSLAILYFWLWFASCFVWITVQKTRSLLPKLQHHAACLWKNSSALFWLFIGSLTAFFFAQLTIVFINSGQNRIIYSLVQMLYKASATRGRIDRLNRRRVTN